MPLRDATRADEFSTPLAQGSSPACTSPTATRSRRGSAGCRRIRRFDRNPLDLADEARGRGVEPERTSSAAQDGPLRFAARGPRRPGELPTRPDAVAGEPAGLLEQGPRVLPPPRARRRGRRRAERGRGARRAPERGRLARGGADRQVRPVHDDRLPDERLGALLGRRAARGDLVREARPLEHRPPSVRPLVQPGDAAALGGADRLRHLRSDRRAIQRARREAPRTRTDLVAAPLLHDTPEELAQPFGEVRDWKHGECEPVPGKTMPKLVAGRARLHGRLPEVAELGPLVEELGSPPRGSPSSRRRRSTELRRCERGPGRTPQPRPRRPRGARRSSRYRASRTDGSRSEGFRALEERTGTPLADIAEEHADVRITFGDTQVQPRKVIASPEWSGMESRDRRYSPFTINVERDVPFRTLTGRQSLYLEHAWMLEYGEGLPIYRPPLNVLGVVGTQLSGEAAAQGAARALAEPALEVVDPLRVPGQPPHADVVPRRTGRVALRRGRARRSRSPTTTGSRCSTGTASSSRARSSRIGSRSGVGMMYHSQDRHVNVPGSEISGHPRRNRQLGHAHLDEADAHDRRLCAALLGFNYYGPCGSQRDEMVVVRKLQGEVDLLMKVRAQIAMVMNLDKCIGCHTCSVTCKNVWTNRARARSTSGSTTSRRSRASAIRSAGRTRSAGRAAGSSRAGKLRLKAGRPPAQARDALLQPRAADARRLLRALDLRLRDAHDAPARRSTSRSPDRSRW